ncbi:hypothetical protein LOTGIDRAFT_157367 [Lottia gigantea]|uniref:Uncharacterized protein n=1 Tax=Lottia gigantea TaxID=225164 RepID=V4ADW9_LOTGI|nr:hypothetical protein LOTGIDRAFT_157367 [Lottia gigantea]ESP02209.1 hypothetical protein LOTGIDRAFT_157367 [Lottia gigantea]
MTSLYIVLLFLPLIKICSGDFTKIALKTDQHINANEATRVRFDRKIIDSDHHYHIEDRTIDITKDAQYRIEGHATLSGNGAHQAEVRLVEIKDGGKNVLDVCHTYDEDVSSDRCKLLATTKLKPGEKIYLEVKAARDAIVNNIDTYIFLAGMHKDY